MRRPLDLLVSRTVGLCAILLVFAFGAIGQSRTGIGRNSKIESARRQPFVRLLDAERMRTLLGRRGGRQRPLMLYLFYTDCRPCTDRLVDVERVFDEYQGNGLDMALVSIAPMDNERKLLDLLGPLNPDISVFLVDKLDDDFAEEFFLRDWEPVVPSIFFYSSRGGLEYSVLKASSITYPSLRRQAAKSLRRSHKN